LACINFFYKRQLSLLNMFFLQHKSQTEIKIKQLHNNDVYFRKDADIRGAKALQKMLVILIKLVVMN